MILPFNVSATFVANTAQVFALTDATANPTYYTTPGVPTKKALLCSTVVTPDSDGITVEFGVGDSADIGDGIGGNFSALIPLMVGNDCQYQEGRVRGSFSATRVPTLRITSKTNQTARVSGHVELGGAEVNNV